MMPARRAAWIGSPFLLAPPLISFRAAADIAIEPRATASRSVTGLVADIDHADAALRIDVRQHRGTGHLWHLAPLAFIVNALRKIERQALQRHGQVDALHLHAGRHLQRAGREIQDRLDAGGHHLVEHVLRRFGRHGDHGDVDVLLAHDLLQLLQIVNRHAAPRLVADLGIGDVEHRHDLEAFALEARIVGQRQAEVAGAHHRDAQLAIEAEDLAQVALQVLDVIADAADAELAEVGEVLADLRRVEVELLGQRLRRDGLDAGGLELVEAAQVDRQPIGGQLGNRLGGRLPLVR